MGAMMYERHKDKIRKDASWWCQAETVVGCINAWQLTGEQSYLAVPSVPGISSSPG